MPNNTTDECYPDTLYSSQLPEGILIDPGGGSMFFCGMACLGIIFPRSAMIIAFTASVYFSRTLYVFLSLIADYYGGSEEMYRAFSGRKVQISTMPLLRCFICIPSINLNRKTYCIIRRLVAQNTIERAMVVFLVYLLMEDGRYIHGNITLDAPYTWLTTVHVISTCTAMQALGIMNRACSIDLHKYRLSFKFLCIQCILLMTNIQLSVILFIDNFGLIPCRGMFNGRARVYNIHFCMIVFEFFTMSLVAAFLYRSRGDIDDFDGHVSQQEKMAEEGLKTISYIVTETETDFNKKKLTDAVDSDKVSVSKVDVILTAY
ncbi:organic solute transporter subunit alpha-like [Glandiceps talaboti]